MIRHRLRNVSDWAQEEFDAVVVDPAIDVWEEIGPVGNVVQCRVNHRLGAAIAIVRAAGSIPCAGSIP